MTRWLTRAITWTTCVTILCMLAFITSCDPPEPEPVEQFRDLTGARYLIITKEKFVDAITPLADWKNLKGAGPVKILTLDEDATPEDISYYLKNAYDRWDITPKYVLFVGDHDEVPSNNMGPMQMFPDHDSLTDTPYACVAGDDNLSDLITGRIPVNTAAELTAVVEKILDYDRSPEAGDWLQKGLIAATTDGGDWYAETALHVAQYLGHEQNLNMNLALVTKQPANSQFCFTEKEDSQYPNHHRLEILSRYEPFKSGSSGSGECLYPYPTQINGNIPVTFDDYIVEGSWPNTKSQLIKAFQDGLALVYHRDHGYPDGWVDPDFRVGDIAGELNTSHPPVVFNIACMTGAFNYNQGDCFSEALLKYENGGAVAVIAASDESHPGLNEVLTHGMFDYFFDDYDPLYTAIEPLFQQGAMRPAEALQYGLRYMVDRFEGAEDDLTKEQIERYHFFGDPEMPMRMTSLSEVEVVHSDNVTAYASQDFSVSVAAAGNALANATVCLSKPGTKDYWTGTTNENGQAVLAGLEPHHGGEYDMVVTHPKTVTYEGKISSTISGPFAQLSYPEAGAVITSNPYYVDIEWHTVDGSDIERATIDVSDITIQGVWITSVQVLQNNLCRYSYFGDLPDGLVHVVLNEKAVADTLGNRSRQHTMSYRYETSRPVGKLIYPAPGSSMHEAVTHVDIQWLDPGLGIDTETIDATDIHIPGVAIMPGPKLVGAANNVWRYVIDGRLDWGTVYVTLEGDAVADIAGNTNETLLQSFELEIPEIRLDSQAVADVVSQGKIKEFDISLHNAGNYPLDWSASLSTTAMGAQKATHALSREPYTIAYGGGCFWLGEVKQTITKLDRDTGETAVLDLGRKTRIFSLSYGDEKIWALIDIKKTGRALVAYNAGDLSGPKFKKQIESIVKADAMTYHNGVVYLYSDGKIVTLETKSDVLQEVSLQKNLSSRVADICFMNDYLWIAVKEGVIYKVNPNDGRVCGTINTGISEIRSLANDLDQDKPGFWIAQKGSVEQARVLKNIDSGVSPWANVAVPQSGTIDPFGSDAIALRFDAASVEIGAYNFVLKILSNDPYSPELEVAIEMVVQ